MPRATWKIPYCDPLIIRQFGLEVVVGDKSRFCDTWSRASVVEPWLVGKSIRVHDGKNRVLITPQESQVGYKLGSLVLTKTIGSFVHKHNRLILKKKKALAILRQRKVKRRSGAKKVVKKLIKKKK